MPKPQSMMQFGSINVDTYPPKPPQPAFSYFNPPVSNTVPSRSITLAECARLIEYPYPLEKRTAELRALTSAEQRKAFKASRLPYVTFSGVFSRRSDKALKIPSGLMVLDFDHLQEPEAIKQDLRLDWEINPCMIFISPSGDGLKVIVSVELIHASHSGYFDVISDYLFKTYGLKADPSGRDISRACFLCHDPKVFLHPEYNDFF